MNNKKKLLLVISLILSLVVFTTTALADIFVGSAYTNLKNDLKNSFEFLENETNNFSYDFNLSFHIDDILIYKANDNGKIDIENNMKENTRTDYSIYYDEKTTFYYTTPEYRLYKHDTSAQLYNNYSSSSMDTFNPFDSVYAEDIEKIADAFVFPFEDLLVLTPEDDGKLYRGNMSTTQVPALANALTSLATKSIVSESDPPNPIISKIYIDNVYGNATSNSQNVITSLDGGFSIKGLDKNGDEHTYYFKASVSFKDINNTVIDELDLSTIENLEDFRTNDNPVSIPIVKGKYVKDVFSQTNEEITKIGQDELIINTVEDDEVTGTYIVGDEKFTFTGKIDYNEIYCEFQNENTQMEGTIYLLEDTPNLLELYTDYTSSTFRKEF